MTKGLLTPVPHLCRLTTSAVTEASGKPTAAEDERQSSTGTVVDRIARTEEVPMLPVVTPKIGRFPTQTVEQGLDTVQDQVSHPIPAPGEYTWCRVVKLECCYLVEPKLKEHAFFIISTNQGKTP